jgi:endonuclease G
VNKILLLVTLLFSLTLVAQRDSVSWYSAYVNGVYSETLEQPLSVSYMVLCTKGDVSRKNMRFHTEKTIATSDNADYVNNVWDKGHLAPAADFKCDESAMRGTFTFLNCALQHEKLNRGVWKYLEAHERNLSNSDDVSILIEVDFLDAPEKVPGGASIPFGFYKQITIGDKNECYWFPNKLPESNNFKDYECPCRN